MNSIEEAIQALKFRIEWEQECVDKMAEDVKENAQSYDAYSLVTFLPGKIRNLEESVNRLKSYKEQLSLLEHLKKQEG